MVPPTLVEQQLDNNQGKDVRDEEAFITITSRPSAHVSSCNADTALVNEYESIKTADDFDPESSEAMYASMYRS